MSERAAGLKPIPRGAALLSSLLCVGSGHLLRGRPWRAVGWLGAVLGAILAVPLLGPLGMGLVIAMYLAAHVDLLIVSPGARWSNRKVGWRIVGLLAFLFVFRTVVRALWVEAYAIRSGSMMPTLVPGDNILVAKLPWSPKRGDVVVFHKPTELENTYLHRAIGLGGDTLVFRGGVLEAIVPSDPAETVAFSRVFLASASCDEEHDDTIALRREVLCDRFEEVIGARSHLILYGKRSSAADTSGEEGEERFLVPPDHVFVLGDNRDNSADSRMWGSVPPELLIGRAAFVWWPGGQVADWSRVVAGIR